jgi:hypothetical protein
MHGSIIIEECTDDGDSESFEIYDGDGNSELGSGCSSLNDNSIPVY